jgi:hypothetical protein
MSPDGVVETQGEPTIPVEVLKAETRTLQLDGPAEHACRVNLTNYGSIRHALEPGENRRVYVLECGFLVVPDSDEEDPLSALGEFEDVVEPAQRGFATDGGDVEDR